MPRRTQIYSGWRKCVVRQATESRTGSTQLLARLEPTPIVRWIPRQVRRVSRRSKSPCCVRRGEWLRSACRPGIMQCLSIISAIAFVAIGGSAATAQLDPGMIAQGQVLAGTARGYAERGGWREGRDRNSASEAARACASLPNFRARYGAQNAKVQKLTRLCRRAGY